MPQPPADPSPQVQLDRDHDRIDVPGAVAAAIFDVARGGSRGTDQAQAAGRALAEAGAGDLAAPGPTLAGVLDRLARPVVDWRLAGRRGVASGSVTAEGGVAALPYDGGQRVILGLHDPDGLADVFAYVAPVPDPPPSPAPPPVDLPAGTIEEAMGRGQTPPGLSPDQAQTLGAIMGALRDHWRIELVPGGAPPGARGTERVELLDVAGVLALLEQQGPTERLRAVGADEVRAAQRELAAVATRRVRDRARATGGPEGDERVRYGRPGTDAPGGERGPDPSRRDRGDAPAGGDAGAGAGDGMSSPGAATAPGAPTSGDPLASGPPIARGAVALGATADAGARPPDARQAPDASGAAATGPSDEPRAAPGVRRTADGHPAAYDGEQDGTLVRFLSAADAGPVTGDGRPDPTAPTHAPLLATAALDVAGRGEAPVRWEVAGTGAARAWAAELERLGHAITVVRAGDEGATSPPEGPAAHGDDADETDDPGATVLVLWRAERDPSPRAAGARLLAAAGALREPVGADGLRTVGPGGGDDLAPDEDALERLVGDATEVPDADGAPWPELGRHVVVDLVAGAGPRARLTARVLVDPSPDRGDALVVELARDLAPDVAADALEPLVRAWDPDWACVETTATGDLRRTDPARPDVLYDAERTLDARLHWRTWLSDAHADALDLDGLRRAAASDRRVRVEHVAGGTLVALGGRFTDDDAVVARALRLEPVAFAGRR